MSEPIAAKSVSLSLGMCKETSPYMIMGMIMLVLTGGTMNVIIAVRVVMMMVVYMMWRMRMSMVVRMSVVRMTAHCYHSE